MDEVDGLDDLGMRAWRGFLRAHSVVIRSLDAELSSERGLGVTSYEVLLILAWSPGRALRMSELADRVLLSPSGTSRLVDGLVGRGLVRRRRCPTDGRSYLAELTEDGLERLRDATPVHLRGVREHFSGPLTEFQLEVLAEAMEAITGGRPAARGRSRAAGEHARRTGRGPEAAS